MPLSKPTTRQHIHTRDIHCRAYRRDDGLWDVEASLADTKTYSFANIDRGGVNAGEPVHSMSIRLSVDENLVVRAAEAAIDAAPFGVCADITPSLETLKDLAIAPGWRQAVLERLGSTRGCTHLTEMLLGPLATVALQAVTPFREKEATSQPGGGGPGRLNTCHAMASDGPVVKKRWPEFYNGH